MKTKIFFGIGYMLKAWKVYTITMPLHAQRKGKYYELYYLKGWKEIFV